MSPFLKEVVKIVQNPNISGELEIKTLEVFLGETQIEDKN